MSKIESFLVKCLLSYLAVLNTSKHDMQFIARFVLIQLKVNTYMIVNSVGAVR